MSNSIQPPVKIGSKTNIGTIKSYKYIRYGFSKYRYFTLEGKHSYGQDEITEVYNTVDEVKLAQRLNPFGDDAYGA